MKNFFRNRGILAFVIVVIIFSIIIGVVNYTNPEATFGENVFNVTIAPVQKFFSWIGNGVSDFFGYFSDKDDLRDKIASLEKENAELKTSLGQITLSKTENDELRGLLALQEAYPENELIYGEVIARDSSGWYNSFTVDVGSSDGIAVNQPVLSQNNTLVGRVTEVGTTWAKITTVFDSEHSVGAVIARSGEYCVISGNPDDTTDGSCLLSYISKKTDIIVGDMIMTSGLGGVFPEGILIGQVKEVKQSTDGTSAAAVVTPVADIENLRTVGIVQNYKSDLR